MKHRKSEDKEKDGSDRWLLTYADMMNNLLILFMVLYAMSVIDAAKFQEMAEALGEAFSSTQETTQTMEQNTSQEALDATQKSEVSQEVVQEFNEVYITLQTKLKEKGYTNLVQLDKGENYINIRFGDNVLFYPDSPVIKQGQVQVLIDIGDVLYSVNPLLEKIEIGGHTATTGEKTDSLFSWELSSERAVAVLECLVKTCSLPESKMSVTGYSRYQPIANNQTESGRELNRRVEITITRLDQKTTASALHNGSQ